MSNILGHGTWNTKIEIKKENHLSNQVQAKDSLINITTRHPILARIAWFRMLPHICTMTFTFDLEGQVHFVPYGNGL